MTCSPSRRRRASAPSAASWSRGRLAPLKWLEPAREAGLVDQRADQAFPIATDPLLTADDSVRLGAPIGSEVEVHGVGYPMYVAGTIVGITVWGLYVRPA